MAAIAPEDGKSSVAFADLTARNQEPVPQRIAQMRAHLGIDDRLLPSDVAEELTRRCTSCRSRSTCTRWLLFGGFPLEYREFCPNAARFEELQGARQVRPGKAGSTAGSAVLPDSPSETLKRPAETKWLLVLGSAFLAVTGSVLIWAVR